MDVSIGSAASPAHTHPSIKGAALRAAPLSWIPLWMDVCGLVRQQMRWKHHKYDETCVCMQITRNSCGYDNPNASHLRR